MNPDIKVGAKAFEPGNRHYPATIVDIRDVDNETIITVRWYNGDLLELSPEDFESDLVILTPEVEERERQLKENLQTKMGEVLSAFDLAFQKWREAQDLIDQSPDYSYGVRSDPDLKPVFKSFEDKVEAAGWSTSSLYC